MSTAARSRAFPAKRKTPTSKTPKATSTSTSKFTSARTSTTTSKKTRPVRTQRDEDEDEDEDDDSAQHVDMNEDGDDNNDNDGDVEDGSDGSVNELNEGDEILDDDDISAPRNHDDDDGGIDEPDGAFDDEMEQGTTFGATLAELLHQDLKQEDKPILGLKAHKLDELEISQKQLKHEAKMKRMKTVEKKALLEKDHVTKPEFSEKERKLRQIATRGVVTLFNAVTKQQRSLRESAEEKSSVTKDSVSSLSKDGFLQLLKQESNHVQTAPSRKIGGKKDQDQDEEDRDEKTAAPGWKALKQDYMMGGNKLKDWDKELSDDDEEEEEEEQGRGDRGGGDEGSDD